ncbi:hypothetical protein HFP15_39940 [Amycolatopsis sp. K13G38]|uniref:Uncharacterized protein n=1 Tax=Amycolatopsis acididurans TaxID=2724524 RepID=A0ABX1JL97_9PSEU|nr:hypothetical protein [Amycolatopsis acididurans]NKQ59032.1 hypothetical protein [Amycolatopsis acididurans]
MRSMDDPGDYATRAHEAAASADEDSRAIAFALLAVAASLDRLAQVHEDNG